MSVEACLQRLHALHPKVIDLSLGRIEGLLAKLDNPERSLPPVIHVAGTNGKGSVIAMLRAIFEAAGYRAHVFSSPHLVRFNERIRLAGKLIEDDALVEVIDECVAVNGDDAITFFEITTAAAFLAFSRTPADVVLLETGLGGRLDATNVLAQPALTILTPVSMDHESYLGDTVKKVMEEKAGILKPGVPCISATSPRRAGKVLTEAAEAIGATLLEEGKDWHVRKASDGLTFEAGGHSRNFPRPKLTGAHQIHNAGLAIAAIGRLPDFDVPDAAIALGLKAADWPARLQRLDHGKLADVLPDGWELWLDGGHNPAAAKTLASHTRQWRDKPLHMVFAMMETKEPVAYLQFFEGKVGALRCVAVSGQENARSAAGLAAIATDLRFDAAPSDSVMEALIDIAAGERVPSRVLICGSLYLAGEVLRENDAD